MTMYGRSEPDDLSEVDVFACLHGTCAGRPDFPHEPNCPHRHDFDRPWPGFGELIGRLVAFVIVGGCFLVVFAVLYWLVANGWGSFTVPIPWSNPVVPSLGPVPWPTPGA